MTSELRGNGRRGEKLVRDVTWITISRRAAVWTCIAVCALTSACAGGRHTVVVWEKPGAGPEELEEARRACLEQPTPSDKTAHRRDRLEADTLGREFVECMEARGWTWKTRDLNE